MAPRADFLVTPLHERSRKESDKKQPDTQPQPRAVNGRLDLAVRLIGQPVLRICRCWASDRKRVRGICLAAGKVQKRVNATGQSCEGLLLAWGSAHSRHDRGLFFLTFALEGFAVCDCTLHLAAALIYHNTVPAAMLDMLLRRVLQRIRHGGHLGSSGLCCSRRCQFGPLGRCCSETIGLQRLPFRTSRLKLCYALSLLGELLGQKLLLGCLRGLLPTHLFELTFGTFLAPLVHTVRQVGAQTDSQNKV